MIQFPATALTRDPASLKEAARRGPVAITEHKRLRFVLMSYEAYEAMASSRELADPRHSYATAETPDELRALIMEGLDLPYEA